MGKEGAAKVIFESVTKIIRNVTYLKLLNKGFTKLGL